MKVSVVLAVWLGLALCDLNNTDTKRNGTVEQIKLIDAVNKKTTFIDKVDRKSEEASSSSPRPENTSEGVSPNTTTVAPPLDPVLPAKGSAEAEHNSSMAIFFVLCVLALGILLIHFMLLTHFQYLPESIAIVFLGTLIGLILNLMSDQNIGNWRKEEAFSPTAFFLVLLPPIIFESGYNLHKGNLVYR